jgi:type I restriction enzyme S subunit
MKTISLGDVCTFQRGLTYTKSDEVNFSNSSVLRATNVDVKTNRLIFDEIRYIKDDVNVPANKKIRRDSLLICTASGSKAHVGKVALVDGDYDHAFGGFMGQITPTKDLLSKYLFYTLISPQFKDFLMSLNDGTNINNLKFSDIEDYKTLLPCLSEQKAIVEKLDAAFAEIDDLERNLRMKISKGEAFKMSCIGKVVSDKNNISSLMSNLVESIKTGGTPPTGDSDYFAGDILWYTPGDFGDEMYLDASKRTLSQKAVENARTKIFEPESLLLVSIGATLGKVALIDKPASANQQVTAIRFSGLHPMYAYYWFKYNAKNLMALSPSTTLPILNQARLRDVVIFHPADIAEQRKAALQLMDVLHEVNCYVDNLRQQMHLVVQLRLSILSLTFTEESNAA